MPSPYKKDVSSKSPDPRDNFYPPGEKSGRGVNIKQNVSDRKSSLKLEKDLRDRRVALRLYLFVLFLPFAISVILYIIVYLARRFISFH